MYVHKDLLTYVRTYWIHEYTMCLLWNGIPKCFCVCILVLPLYIEISIYRDIKGTRYD